MTPVWCISASRNEFGDCFRACIASILDLPAADVPNFAHLGGYGGGVASVEAYHETYRLARRWLAGRGLGLFNTWVSGEWPVEKVLRCFSTDNPGVPFILHGEAEKQGDGAVNHAVVVLDGVIAHDPGCAGLRGPAAASIEGEAAWWWIDVISVAGRPAS